MVIFSDGVWLPFLPSDLPLEGRFRLLVRQADRQLRIYQKRLRGKKLQGGWDPTDPGRLIAMSYLLAVERADATKPPELREGINPQGAYPDNFGQSPPTARVSSVGPIKPWLRPGKYKLDVVAIKDKGLAADFRNCGTGLRAREGEFLVGSYSMEDGFHFDVSYDGNAIDQEQASMWKRKLEGLLETGVRSKL